MNPSANDFKIGLFVLVAVGLFLGATFVFGASKFFEKRTLVETYVDGNVEGLKEGAPVTLRGVPVGEVTRVTFTWNVYRRPEPRYVLIEFAVRGEVSLVPQGRDFSGHLREEVKKGLRARIKSQGLVGNTVVSLEYLEPTQYPPVPVPWRPRHVYIPSAPGQFSQMLAALEKTMSRLQELDVEGLAETLRKDLASAGRVLEHLEQVDFAGIASNANTLLVDLGDASARVRALLGTADESGSANLAALSSQTGDLVSGLQRSVTNWNRMIATLDTF